MNTTEFLQQSGFKHNLEYYLAVASVEEWYDWFKNLSRFIDHFSVDDCLFCRAAITARKNLDTYDHEGFNLKLCQICMFGRPLHHCGIKGERDQEVIDRAKVRLADVGIFV